MKYYYRGKYLALEYRHVAMEKSCKIKSKRINNKAYDGERYIERSSILCYKR